MTHSDGFKLSEIRSPLSLSIQAWGCPGPIWLCFFLNVYVTEAIWIHDTDKSGHQDAGILTPLWKFSVHPVASKLSQATRHPTLWPSGNLTHGWNFKLHNLLSVLYSAPRVAAAAAKIAWDMDVRNPDLQHYAPGLDPRAPIFFPLHLMESSVAA